MNPDKLGIIVQARMSSSRLPGKVLLPFYQDQSILEIIIAKLKKEIPELQLVVATSNQPSDEPIQHLCDRLQISVYRGDENDVLNRFISAAEKNHFTSIIRICADNPFLDLDFLRKLVEYWQSHQGLDYLSYKNAAGLPSIKTHWGVFAEVVSLNALRKVDHETTDSLYHEHVTNFIYTNPEYFNITLLDAPNFIIHRADLRFTVDTKSDFSNNRELYEVAIERGFNNSLSDVIKFLDAGSGHLQNMKEQIELNTK